MTPQRDARKLIAATFTAASALLACAAAASAQVAPDRPGGFGAQRPGDDLVAMRVATDTEAINPGDTFHLVFIFDISKTGWHLYWKNPAAGAAPIEINVTGPSGFTIGAVRWPRPEIFESSVGDMYGYEDQVALFVPVRAPIESVPEASAFRYDVAWAVCDDKRCVMGQRRGMQTVTRGRVAGSDDGSELQRLIRTHRNRLPVDANESRDFDVKLEGDTLTVSGPAKGYTNALLLPDPTPGVRFGQPKFTFEEGRFRLTVAVQTKPRNFAGTKPAARGLIGLGEDADGPSVEFAVPLN